MRKILAIAIAGLFWSCASTQKNIDRQYTQNIDVYQQKKTSGCPGKFTDSSWRKLLSETNSCLSQGKLKKVQSASQIMLRTYPKSPWGGFYQSELALRNNRLDRAAWMADLALQKAPDFGLFHYQKARVLWAQKNREEAYQAVHKAIENDNRLTSGHYFLATLYHRDGLNQKAFEKYMTVIKSQPKHKSSYEGAIAVAEKLNDRDELIKILLLAQKNLPSSNNRLLKLAKAYEKEDLKKALEYYTKLSRRLSRNSKVISSKDLSQKIDDLKLKLKKQDGGQS